MLPVWVISLEESVKRRSEVARLLHHFSLPFSFFPAIDGRRLSPAEISATYSKEQTQRAIGRQMTPGEIGCSLSHMAVYRRMIDENIESLVVLEDDARISADLRSVLERAGQWPHDWDILFLYHQGNDANHISLRKRVQLGPRHCIVRFSDRPLGTVAYAVRSSAARKLLCAGLPISAPADELLNGYASRISLCRYGIHPVVVEHACSNDSFLAAERMRANASLHMTTFSLSRFLPNSLYRRGRRCVKFGKRFFRRYIV